jgi:hypothetical protein
MTLFACARRSGVDCGRPAVALLGVFRHDSIIALEKIECFDVLRAWKQIDNAGNDSVRQILVQKPSV